MRPIYLPDGFYVVKEFCLGLYVEFGQNDYYFLA